MKMKAKDVAKKYNVTTSAVYQWIKEGLEYDVKVGNGKTGYVFNSEKVEEFIEKKKNKFRGRE